MSTIATLSAQTGVTVDTDWSPDFTVPVTSGVQRQGDVIVVPSSTATPSAPVPQAGCPVVRGESGGNTHAIHAADGDVWCDTRTADPDSLIVATLTVADGATAYLAHPEHGFLGIAPGSYEIRRQREMANELRMVAD